MNEQNIEMLTELRKFVIETAKNADKAAPAQLEAMTEAAKILLGLRDEARCGAPLRTRDEIRDALMDQVIALDEERSRLKDVWCAL